MADDKGLIAVLAAGGPGRKPLGHDATGISHGRNRGETPTTFTVVRQ
jgi:hypothetical protein